MFAAIPYLGLTLSHWQIFGTDIALDPWAILVATGCVVGMEVARYRAIRLGLDVRDVVDGVVVVVGLGFIMGHVITVLAYHPERLREDGVMSLLRLWQGFSSFGGFLGAVIGAVLFYKVIRPRDFWRHADVIIYGFPFGWLFGRLGCFSVHDHIGSLTSFPLGMHFPSPYVIRGFDVGGVRHELGLYEALLFVGVCAAWIVLGRRDRAPGFFVGWLAVVYAPIRFFLDSLRATDLPNSVADARYLSLTPAQWGCIVMFGLGVWVLRTTQRGEHPPWPLDGSGAPPEEVG